MPDTAHSGPSETLREIALDIIDHVTSGRHDDQPLWDRHYHPEFESVESDGMTHRGRDHVLEKHKWFYDNFAVHGTAAAGMYFGTGGFGILWEMDMEARDGSMPRTKARELALYTVRDGKVVREEFWQAPM